MLSLIDALAEIVAAEMVPVNVGEADRTTFPLPVLVVTPVPPFATGRVPVTPVERGRPVTLVITPDAGVPSAGVTSVGELDRTTFPVPVLLVTPVPPFATGSVPVMPVVAGKPVQFVRVPEVGVPRTGAVSVGAVSVLFVSVCVPVSETGAFTTSMTSVLLV